MIAIDTNVLVHAHHEESPKHRAALGRLETLAGTAIISGIPVSCIGGFLRVISHRRLLDPPRGAVEACNAITRSLAPENFEVLRPGPNYLGILIETVREVDAVGNFVFDAQIVASCREYGVSALITEDRDFERFESFNTEQLPARARC